MKSKQPAYLNYLKKSAETIQLADGTQCELWDFKVPDDELCLAEWAMRFRQTYCLDVDIDTLREGTGLSRGDFLLQLIFPDEKVAPGPSIRAGDFAELLISDYVEYFLGFWVPRGKYAEKGSRDESVKGVDIIGFKFEDALVPKLTDSLLAFEVKAQLSDTKYTARLQVAVNDSAKDYLRAAETLAAMKRRLHIAGKVGDVKAVQRFQNPVDNPYELHSGAAAVLSGKSFDVDEVKKTDISKHNNVKHLGLLVIRGNDLMTLAHAVYLKAANEA